MGPPQARANRAKRKLELDNEIEAKNKHQDGNPGNTAIEVTEYTSRQKQNNTNSNASKVRKTGRISQKNDDPVKNRKLPTPKQGRNKSNQNANSQEETMDRSSIETSSCNARRDSVIAKNPINQTIPGGSLEWVQIPDELDVIRPNQEEMNADEIKMGINPLDDNFHSDSDDDEVVIAPNKGGKEEEIPPEIIEQLKANPILKQYIGDVVKATINSVTKGKDNWGENADLVRPSSKRKMQPRIGKRIRR